MAQTETDDALSYGRIFRFWLPLAGTWMMMAVEGPFLAAVIARLGSATENLAAFGVAVAFAFIIEAPVIMLLSAATALVKDKTSYLALRRFTHTLSAGLTALMLLLLLPPVFRFLAGTLLSIPRPVADLTHGALVLLLPWPGAIGYRRFLQGTLVRHDMTRRVAYGTMIRVGSMAVGAATGALLLELRGAHVGALALSTGVVAEAIASRLMAAGVIGDLVAGRRRRDTPEELTLAGISAFYFPLATMSILAMAIHPMLTFFMGRSRLPIESLAVLPVVQGLAFFFRSLGLSYQEVTIALMGDRGEHLDKIRNFAVALALAGSAGLALIVFTPLAEAWFRSVAGLSAQLTALALTPARIASVLPALTVLLAVQRALLVAARLTRPLTGATVVEVSGIALVLSIGIFALDVMGAVAATAALVLGRLAGNAYLAQPCVAAIGKLRGTTG
jgi:hypothetical protein